MPSPEPEGERISLDAPSLLDFLERQMVDPTKFHCVPRLLTKDHMMFPLSGHDAALQQAAECMKVIAKPISQTTRFIGKFLKTRMLEELMRIFDLAEIPNSRLGVLVLYHNGHMPHPVERKMTIEASFAWRLLHRCFMEGNGEGFAKWFTESLPVNGAKLNLRLALAVIRQKCFNLGMLKSNETLHFLGIDEYQTIHEVGGKKRGNEELLQDLLNVLGDILASPVAGVCIYPMFAGTDFSVISIVNTSRTESLRMPVYLLTQSDVETAIFSIPNGYRLLLQAPDFHALRINSLIIVGHSIVEVNRLFKGAIVNGCEDEVELKPMLVMETEDKFSTDMLSMIGRKGNYNERHDWLKEGLVVINGEGGEGVDVFFALKKNSSDGYVLFTDQRKKVGENDIGPVTLEKLLRKARIIPGILEANSKLVP